MESINLVIDDGTGKEFDFALRDNALQDGGDLSIITKDNAMESGRAGVLLTFSVDINGIIKRAQTVVPMRLFILTTRMLQNKYTDEGYKR